MKSVVAFIVGIERYDMPGWDVAGPRTNAVAIAEWCVSVGVLPANVFLFLEAKPKNGANAAAQEAEVDARAAGLKAKGVNLEDSAKFNVIDTFFRTGLAKGRPADSRLLVFWSGHGFVENDNSRIFICRDYTDDALFNRVFNASNFLRYLRSDDFVCFSEQIFVADVCGVYPNDLRFSSDRAAPKHLVNTVKQTAYFATPEGKYALGGAGRGIFTDLTMGVLGRFKEWPTQELFVRAMESAFQGVGETPFRISVLSDQEEGASRLVGTIPTENRGALFQSLVSLLSAIPLPDSVFRHHYLRTVSDLGDPKLAEAQGVSGMVTELMSLSDRALPDDLPYGLIQFLVRLCQEDGLAATIEAWLDEHAAHQGNARADVIEKLKFEGDEKLLIVELMHDEKGQISGFQPFLRRNNLRPVTDFDSTPQDVKDWGDFEGKLLEVIRELRQRLGIKDFQIHFLADPPLFDRPFHEVPFGQGSTLGEEFVVVVRHRERARSKASHIRAAWQGYADVLRRSLPSQVKFIQIPAPGGAASLPDEKGLCYAGFILRPSGSPCVGPSSEKQILRRLMLMGVPYLYWLHNWPSAGDMAQVEKTLATCLHELSTLDPFPQAFTQQRISGNAYARQASLLWDDPQFNPFSVPGEV